MRVLAEAPGAGELWPAHTRIEAEALDALIAAPTERAVAFLSYQREHLADYLRGLAKVVRDSSGAARQALRDLLTEATAWRYLVEGAVIVIAGPPNAGKSTLANRLLGRDHAIVSDAPGTTRDWVAEPAALHGVPVTIVDTAGLRTSDDPIEAEGIRRGQAQLARADLCLFVLDPSAAAGEQSLQAHLPPTGPPTLFVLNKTDLPGWRRDLPMPAHAPSLDVSALTGAGIDRLTLAIVGELGLKDRHDLRPGLFTQRQRAAVARVLGDQAIGGPDLAAWIENDLIGVEHRPDRP